MLDRRHLLGFAGSMLAAPALLRAQGSFPAKVVTLVVPYPAGGPTDVIARLVGQAIEEPLKQKVIVENRAGASGAIGTRAVAAAEPDGHTIMFGNDQTHGNNMFLMKAPGYDAIRDFTPIAGAGAFPHALVVKDALAARSLKEFIDLAKAQAGRLNYGSTGRGSGSHLSMELLMKRTGIAMQHVPYQGAPPLVNDIIGGTIDVSLSTLPSVIKQVEAGQMRCLGIASRERVKQLASAPTFREGGVDNADAESWAAFFAPAKVPKPALDMLSTAIVGALNSRPVAEKIEALGFALNVRRPEAFVPYLQQEIDTWADIIKQAGIQPE